MEEGENEMNDNAPRLIESPTKALRMR